MHVVVYGLAVDWASVCDPDSVPGAGLAGTLLFLLWSDTPGDWLSGLLTSRRVIQLCSRRRYRADCCHPGPGSGDRWAH